MVLILKSTDTGRIPPHASTPTSDRRLTVTSAHRAYLTTTCGRTIFDGCSGAINVNLGHTHPDVVNVMSSQAADLHFAWRGLFSSAATNELRSRLTAATNGAMTHHLLASSGSDGLEQAFRVAWTYHARVRHRGRASATPRTQLLAEWPSYHGMSSGALGVSGHPVRHRSFGDMDRYTAPEWVRAPERIGARASAQAWRGAIHRAGERLAAVVVEPVGGAASGAAPQEPETLRAIREAASDVGALVIADEVMTGFGRAGALLASADMGLDADIVVASKGLGAGYMPIAATMVRAAVGGVLSDAPDLGTFGHTMAESPVAAAVANTVLKILDEEDIITNVGATGRRLSDGLTAIAEHTPYVGPPRGRGLLHALPVLGDSASDTASLLVGHCLTHDVAVYPAGVDARSASLLIAPPLNSTSGEVDDLLDRLHQALTTFEPKENNQ
ncbi:aminotransferase class III-fold pyridoxal phosphate-dependent enzyme [Mycobacterium sp. BMJ-28]